MPPTPDLNALPRRALRPLAICIDDLGLHAGVNQAAQRLYEAGRVSTWSCLVDGPALPALATWLAQHPHDTLELGLHLNLSEALPGAGWHRPLTTLLWAAYSGALDRTPVRQALASELTRQFDRFEALLGRPADFVDGHQHVHQLPVVRELLLAELDRRQASRPIGTARPWVRACQGPAACMRNAALPWPERLKPWLIDRLGSSALRRATAAAGLSQNRHLLGVRRFDDDADAYQALLATWLAAAGDDDLLMVHPACALPGLDDALIAARQVEFQVLASPQMGALLQRHGLRVASRRSRSSTP
jgi:chitin disaccharide deacetylase